MVIKSINAEFFYERYPNLTNHAFNFLKTIYQSLELRFVEYKKYLFRVDIGEVEIQKEKLVLKNNTKIILLGIETEHVSHFEIRAKLKFQTEGLINLITISDMSAPPADKYYMFRFDTRGGNDHQGNGILLKDRNAPSWKYIDNLSGLKLASKVLKPLEAKINFKGSKARFWIKTNQRGRFSHVASINNWEHSKQIGFLLEKGEVVFTDFNIQRRSRD
jgi:hypothetical protein